MALISKSVNAAVVTFVTSKKATRPVNDGAKEGTRLVLGCTVGLAVTKAAQIKIFE